MGDLAAFVGDYCLFVERAFRYRRPLVCGKNTQAHRVANLGHEFTRTPMETPR